MGLRINTNIASVNAMRNLQKNSGGVERAMERLSSGSRINKAMDDVAGLTISETIRGHLIGMAQAERNAANGVSFVQVAEAGLSETSNTLVRIRELATQAASDTIGEAERGFVDVEVQQLVKELDRIAQTTEFAGTHLLNGSGKTLDFQIGFRSDENNRISYDAGKANATVSALGVQGISVADKDGSQKALEILDDAIAKTGDMRANFGAMQSRMAMTVNSLQSSQEALASANSRIRDADMAKESSELAKSTILQRAGVATLAQANNSTGYVLKLIDG